MKTSIFSILLLSLSLQAESLKDVSKTVKMEIPADPQVELNLDARNTETQVELWDQNKIYIEASFAYRGKEHPRINDFLKEFAQNVADGVEGSGAQVNVKTYRSVPSKLKIGWQEFTFFNWSFSAEEVKLRYLIKVPRGVRLNMKHSYHGLAITGDLEQLDLEQYSGKLRIQKVNKGRISLKYGEASIPEVHKGQIELYEMRVSGKDWNKVQLQAKYSQVRLENSQQLQVEAYESEIEALDIDQLQGDFKYSRFKANNVQQAKLHNYESQFYWERLGALTIEQSKYSEFAINSIDKLNIQEAYEDQYELKTLAEASIAQAKYSKFRIGRLERNYLLNAYESEVDIDQLGGAQGKVQIDGKYLKVRLKLSDKVYTLNADLKYGNILYPTEGVIAQVHEKNSETSANLQSKTRSEKEYSILLSGYEFNARLY